MDSRKARYARYHSLYKKYSNHTACFYCGDIAQTVDHVPALCVLESIGTDYFIDQGVDFLMYPSCLDCNQILGAFQETCPIKRSEYIKQSLSKKHRSLLNAPDWRSHELEELGYSLRQSIESMIDLKRFIERRLDFLSNTTAS